MNSVSIIYDSHNDYQKLLQKSEQFFDVQFHHINSFNANAINIEKEFIIDFTPNELHFLLPNKPNQEKIHDLIIKLQSFITENFKNQKLILKGQETFISTILPEVKDVKVIHSTL